MNTSPDRKDANGFRCEAGEVYVTMNTPPARGNADYDRYYDSCYAYEALALSTAGFPLWKLGILGFPATVDKTEAEQAVRQALGMREDEKIDFSWVDDFYNERYPQEDS